MIDRRSGSVIVWSPPSVITRGRVFPLIAGPLLSASVAGARERISKWPSSICVSAYVLSYLSILSASFYACAAGDLRRNGDITTVKNSGPAVERVGLKGDIVAPTYFLVNIRSIVRVGWAGHTRDSVGGSLVEYLRVRSGHLGGKRFQYRMGHLIEH